MAKTLPALAGDSRSVGLTPGRGRSLGESIFLPGEFQGERNLAGYGP